MQSRRRFIQSALLAPMLPEAMLASDVYADEGPAPLLPIPSPRHLAWHKLEYYAFVHFNMNTFTGKEWGEGYEDPKFFNPQKLDCLQWVRAFKNAGMKGVIITAKHHDGFCLWPSAFTNHSVKSSLWRDGKGDVLRDISNACRKEGLKLGVYLSPWDRNHPIYGTPQYNEFFKNQLREVLTNYGPIFEVWFDGANGEGPNGRKQVYDFPGFIKVVRECQPNAVIFSDAGPDIRWVGNENGLSNETSWSMLRRDEFYPGTPRSAELTSGHIDGDYWVPSECDVSLRPGWFFRDSETSKLKSVQDLMKIYYASVGRNGSLLLNVPANQEGLIAPEDISRLTEFRLARQAAFPLDLARGKSVDATSSRSASGIGAPSNLTHSKSGRYWSAPDHVQQAKLHIDLKNPTELDTILIREEIALGQRIQTFTIDVLIDGSWHSFASGTTIGNCRILRGRPTTTTAVRVTITASRACPVLSQISIYRSQFAG